MRHSWTAYALALTGFALVIPACSSEDDKRIPALVPTGNPNGKDDGGECAVGQDCKSGVCIDAFCAIPTHGDGVQNGDETGLDCGGPTAPKCGGGQACVAPSDCTSDVCEDGVCGGPDEVPASATDGKKNRDETDVDCGGASSPKCGDGKSCLGAPDCTSLVCTANVCQPAKPDDSTKNGDESDVDCGGSTTGAPRCGTDKSCNAADDCESLVCDGATKKCKAPTATDGVKNADEGDIDCGGVATGAPKCAVGKSCNVHEDCSLDGCDDTKHCANGRSCTQLNGGRTCGEGEVGEAGAVHESCCGALTIPGRTTKLDKYKVTAGRMRAFIERVNGNVLGWYDANKASLSAGAIAQIEPYRAYLPTDRNSSTALGSDYQLGATIYLPTRPSNSQGCGVGTAAAPAYGSHTFWNGALEQEQFAFDQAFRDRLPLNCVPLPLMAAFCAWDGGRLQMFDEHAAAYGPTLYPWGATPYAGGYAVIGGVFTLTGPAHAPPNPLSPCPGCDPTYANWLQSYQYPEGGSALNPGDYAYWISPPGRFPKDKGPGGHMDISGVMMELTGTVNGTDVGQTAYRWSKNGSWEGHAIAYGGFTFAFMTKYGKAGGRCARD